MELSTLHFYSIIEFCHQDTFLLNIPLEVGRPKQGYWPFSIFSCHLKLPNYDLPIKRIHFPAGFGPATFDS
jgi:hypothetical protein